MKYIRNQLLCCLCILLLAGCGGGGGSSGLPQVSNGTVTPAAPNVMVGQQMHLRATTTDSMGNILMDRTAVWPSSNSALATVDTDTGLVNALALGHVPDTAT